MVSAYVCETRFAKYYTQFRIRQRPAHTYADDVIILAKGLHVLYRI